MTWTPQQDALLRELHTRHDVLMEEVCRRIGKCASAVHRRRDKLGLPPRSGPNKSATSWPADLVAELKRLWLDDHLSCTDIGKALGKSKNAVVGKAFREGLPSKKAHASNRPKPAAQLPPSRIAPIARSCAWPIGEPGKPGFHFCGAPHVDGSSYCADHHKIAYKPYKLPLRAVINNMDAMR
jgi:GcrA cell cycle regulator